MNITQYLQICSFRKEIYTNVYLEKQEKKSRWRHTFENVLEIDKLTGNKNYALSLEFLLTYNKREQAVFAAFYTWLPIQTPQVQDNTHTPHTPASNSNAWHLPQPAYSATF